MSGLLRRLTRRGPTTADENRSPTAESSEPAAAPADAPAETGGDRPVSEAPGGDRPAAEGVAPAGDPSPTDDRPADDQQTQVLPATGEQAPARPAEPTSADQAATPAGDQTSPGAAWATSGTTEQPTAFAAQPAPARDLPAGVDAGDLSTAPAASARRGKLRRRLRYLRHVRELLLRDLGGFTYEVHRTAGGTPQESHRRLTTAKADRISALDAEVSALEARLGEPHAGAVLREPGIGGTCPECGELHASDARFCSRCGAPLDAKARARRDAAVAAAAEPPPPEAQPPSEPQPASVLWAGGPRPAPEPEPEEEVRPEPVTSQWLIGGDQPTTHERPEEPSDEPPAGERPAPSAWAAVTSATAADEPKTADEPPAADEPEAGDEPRTVAPDESVAAATAREPTAGDEPGAVSEPAGGAEEPTTTEADEPPTAGGMPAADDPAAEASPADEPAPDAPAAGGSDDTPPADPGSSFDRGPNGRRDEDVPPPVTSGDPLAPREQRP